MSDSRTYIRVHDGLMDHPKIEGLSDKAFRLLLGCWCWCSRHLTDGVIPRHIWDRRGTPKSRNELVSAGMVSIANDRIVMHDYLEHQRSADQVAEVRDAKRRASSLGNHNRWHKARGITDPTCQHCPSPPPQRSHTPSHLGSHLRSQEGSQNDRKRSPVSVSETDSPAGLEEGGGGTLADTRGTTPHTPQPLPMPRTPTPRRPRTLLGLPRRTPTPTTTRRHGPKLSRPR